MLDFAVAQTCLNYNMGYEAGHLATQLGISRNENIVKVLRRWDNQREKKLISRRKKTKVRSDPDYAAGAH